MLKVDLGQLERNGRIRIDAAVPEGEPEWEDAGVRLAGPVQVRLEVQLAGADVIVRGEFRGTVREQCRRCLRPIEQPVAETLTLVYRPGLSETEAEALEMYVLTARSREIDLGPALREHLILAGSGYPVCEESCRGLCPTCGRNLNVGSCECRSGGMDPRWGALRELTK